MEAWLFFIISLCVAKFLKSLYRFIFPKLELPPGPSRLELIRLLLSIPKSMMELDLILRNLHAKYGPMVTLRVGSQPVISMSSNSLARQALIQNGPIFAGRPRALHPYKAVSRNHLTIILSLYGPNWRLLRRNMTSQTLHPSRLMSYSHARKWALDNLVSRLGCNSEPVQVMSHFQHAIFNLLALICFGAKLEETQIREIKTLQSRIILSVSRFSMLNFLPITLSKILFRKRGDESSKLFKDQEDKFIPLIRTRQKLRQEMGNQQKHENKAPSSSSSKDHVLTYVDTLLDLQLPEENRKLDEGEITTLCSEFIIAGTDTTSVALEWIMANLVKYPRIQAKLFEEINGVMEQRREEVTEEELQKLPYLKAVVLEGLRLHPPAHVLLPHSVTQDIAFEGYVIPKDTIVNFMVAEIGRDPKIWEDPMEFKPERFLAGEVFDITGSREIKMLPFGAGRRMCPGYGLAILNLEYFVANLVWKFEWKIVEGDDIDLSEKQQEITKVMKNPLQALMSPRFK